VYGYFRHLGRTFLSFSMVDWVHVGIDMVQGEIAQMESLHVGVLLLGVQNVKGNFLLHLHPFFLYFIEDVK